MKKNGSKAFKKLAKSQRKLKRAFAKLGQKAKVTESPAWVTALAAIAGAVTTALADRDKRGRLAEIASEAKDKTVGLLTESKKEEPEAAQPDDIHLEEVEEAHEHV